MKLERNDWIRLGVSVAIPLLAGGLGAIATARSVGTWYRTIKKPDWNPPGWLFGPVWTSLYLMMGVAAWLVWQEGRPRAAEKPLALPEGRQEKQALALYGAQLTLNTLWSVVFFGLRSIGGGVADIIALWGVLVGTVVSFMRIRRAAGLLMLPYLAWVSFAGVLNVTLWRLNRQ